MAEKSLVCQFPTAEVVVISFSTISRNCLPISFPSMAMFSL